MSLDKFEIWVHDHLLKNDKIRHFCYGAYQRALYLASPKIKKEGSISCVTPDDKYEYLFGYYDKCPWSSDSRYMLSMQVRSATKAADSTDTAGIVLIDTKNNNKVIRIAKTHCWNVQQGCMAQWISDDEILYNDFRDGDFCSVILNIRSRKERVISAPVYAVSADKSFALTLDFTRLHRLRPGYGYANIPEKTADRKCPDCTCIWKVDLKTGDVTPVLKYTDFARFEPRSEMKGAEHKVNHLMISPDGKRFMVLHRWFRDGTKYTRLVTANIDGTQMYNLSDDDFVSHCCWKNNSEIISYLNKKDGGKGYYLMTDKTDNYTRLWTQLAMDGHPTCSPNGSLVVTDTYPDRRRMQSLYVMKGQKVQRIGRVFSPFKYGGDVRCDLHPRWSHDGSKLCFDASYNGKRSVCVVDVPKSMLSEKTVQKAETLVKPTVSIIMPCYNAQKLIDETLGCLETQTRRDFEVVCINDGSKDDTLEKLCEWQKKGTLNIRIIDKENGGVSSARNAGLEAATGKYIAFLDADDAYHEEYIERLVDAKEKSGADIAYCRLDRKYDSVMQEISEKTSFSIQSDKQAMDNLLYRMGEFGFYCYLYDAKKLRELGLTFDENTKFGEDREFNWKYICHCRNAAFVDAPMYWYRPNEQSATGSKATWRKTDLLSAVKRIEAYLEEKSSSYSKEFNSYMYARAMWAVAKTFTVSGDKQLFDRLRKEYDVKTCMKRTAKDSSKLVKLASWMYLVHPSLFFRIVGLKK